MTRVRHERHQCNTSATRMLHEQHECDTRVKKFDFDNNMSESIISHPILAIWEMKDCKERNNFILYFKSATQTELCNGKSYIK